MNNVCKAKGLQSIHKGSAELVQKKDITQHKRKKVFTKMQLLSKKRVIKSKENYRRVSADTLAAVFLKHFATSETKTK